MSSCSDCTKASCSGEFDTCFSNGTSVDPRCDDGGTTTSNSSDDGSSNEFPVDEIFGAAGALGTLLYYLIIVLLVVCLLVLVCAFVAVFFVILGLIAYTVMQQYRTW